MAQGDHAQSHDSANISSAQESTDTSSSVPAVVSVSAAATATTTATPSPATSTAPLPSATSSISSTLAAPVDAPSAVSPELLSAPTTTPEPPTASTATTLASQPAAPQQNGDSRAAEPEPSQTPDTEMSSQHPGAPHGQPVSYPGPANPYPSAVGVSAAHYASYPAVSQPTDNYRPSPISVGSSVMSLPSMRTIDSMPQPPGPPGAGPQAMSMGMPMAPVQAGVPFYGHHNMALVSGYGLPSDPMARYALPHDPRLLTRGAKKEIKRRTKTGCLTCRKRRIKCDETHPTCNNCKKSKRECLGYDPIFRQQPGNPTASHIQPAPSSQPTTPSVPSSLPPAIPSSLPSNPPPTARATNSYGNQPSMLPSSYAPSHVSTTSPSLPAPYSQNSIGKQPAPGYPAEAESRYEYASAIDPALQTLPSMNQDNSRLLDHEAFVDNSLHLRAKMKLDKIIDQLGPAPPLPQGAPNEDMLKEMAKVYYEIYAPGLSQFLETNWYYIMVDGKTETFPSKNARLLELMAAFLKVLEAVKANDHTQMASSGILETRIVWELACLPYHHMSTSPEAGNNQEGVPDAETREAKNRVIVLEALLSGEYLVQNPLSVPPPNPEAPAHRQCDFWYNLAEFVRSREDPNSAQAARAREDALGRMRIVLDGLENRDLLYSIAVARELAPHYEPGYGATLPTHLDETDPKNRLAVATKFILSEAQVTGGTTNVVRRFSDIASKAFVRPGVCIGRGS